ncbi:hypothetical protein NLJ89_g1240 [Agrocybe chaxingu]|uniref:FAD-binding PCMH-type domain-containing protein n=1 Tax=Agrocybe chaxingu TaxID=84603 RepID=A0A9W8TFJ2_9AGAR|nr:hypothetical protein NLJ89_g1240 [Agrocybe chaxingu]
MWQLISLFPALLLLKASASEAEAKCGKDAISRGNQKYSCKCYPGDACYPSAKKWQRFNSTVDGNLFVAFPPAAPCYPSVAGTPTFDAAKCADVQANFFGQQWTTDQPIANMWTYWTNETCLPFPTENGQTCTRGFYGDYVITAKTKKHMKVGIDFARENNLRLVIRNTGHDFLGRSTGFGSLVLNTHSFKDVTFTNRYTGPGNYRGGAVTVGAGMQLRDLYRLANAQSPPVVVVGGECPTVGIAGGYIQGGGHGPMSSFYGMAADQALSFEVVTASGKYVTANAVENRDLFWALKGGGPSTFAAIISVTVKTFPEVPAAGIILNINSTHTNDTELFWKGVAAVHDLSNHWVDHGIFIYHEITTLRLHVQPIVGPNMTAVQINAIAKPMFDALESQGVPYSTVTKEFPTFFDLYIDMFEDEGAGSSALVGGRIFVRQDIEENASGIIEAYKTAAANNAFIIGHVVGPGHGAPIVDNAIHPVWRNASSFSITSISVPGNAPLTEKARVQNLITNIVGKAFREAGPHGGAYVNEGDLEEPNWQEEYWGANYVRLYRLKQVWDPKGVFYARTTPGTEDWEVIDFGTRLCKRCQKN